MGTNQRISIGLILFLNLIVCLCVQANGSDNISFTVRMANQHFNSKTATGRFLVLNGKPSYQAVLINDNNYSHAVWSKYDGVININLDGQKDGEFWVFFGLKGSTPDSSPAWMGTMITLTRTTPQICITNPTTNVVAQPYLQLQGYSTTPLASIHYDISNAIIVLTNQAGSIIESYLDMNTSQYTTDYFQCYDIKLSAGKNTIVLSATDPAGNTTKITNDVTMDYSVATNPIIKLNWPQDGMEISGNNFTLRGWTEDSSANVVGQIVDTRGITNVVNGVVERNGNFWIEHLPLSSDKSTLTLTVENSAGLLSVTNISVSQSSLALSMDPIKDDLWLPYVRVTGHVDDTTFAVWVNGVKAKVRSDGSWAAAKVPTTPGGVASFDVKAYAPNERQPDDTSPLAAKDSDGSSKKSLRVIPSPTIYETILNSDGSITLNLVTAPNASSRIYAATNLMPPIVWEHIYTNVSGADGKWQFTDTNANKYPSRFYRTSTP